MNKFEEIKKAVSAAKTEQQLNDIIEQAAFCDDITHDEYCQLYQYAIDVYWKLFA